jgi:hypothetical protein
VSRMPVDSVIFRTVAQEGRKKIIVLLLLMLVGLVAGLTYGLALRADRIETRVFLGSFPIAQASYLSAKELGRQIDLLVRSLIVPAALAEAGLPASEQTVQVSVSDATVIFTSSVRAGEQDIFKALHQRIAEKTRAKAALDLSVQKETINAKIKSLEQSVTVRETTVERVDKLSGQVAEANSRLESSANTDGESAARRCRMVEVAKKAGNESELVCDSSTLAAEQKLAAAITGLDVTVEGRDNRLKLEELEADLKVNRLLASNLFVEPAIISVATITSVPRTAFGIMAALLGALLGFIVGLAALTTWVIVRGVTFESG